MDKKRIVIIGAGGHGQVVADILLASAAARGEIEMVGFLDDDKLLHGRVFLGAKVHGPLQALKNVLHDAVIVAIGSNRARYDVFQMLREQGEAFASAVHPSAIIGRDVLVSGGTVICAGVVVNTGSSVGSNVIINTACSIDHHNIVKDHAHVAPGVHLGGGVSIGEGAFVGIGSTVIPGRSVGEWCTVGAGACVTRDVSAHATVVGIPAQPIRKK